MKLAGLAAVVMPITVLVFTAIAVSLARRAGRPAQRRSARLLRDPLWPHLAGQQQRVGLGRPDRQHHLLQHHRRHRHADRSLRDHDPGPGAGRRAGGQERGARRRSGRSAPTTPCSSGCPSASSSSSAASPSSPPSRSVRSSSSSATESSSNDHSDHTTRTPSRATRHTASPRSGASSTAEIMQRGPRRRLQEARPPGADQEPGHVRRARRHRSSRSSSRSRTPGSSTGPSPSGCSSP